MDSDIKTAGYENVYVACPHCKKENTYNRRDDLGTTDAIARKDGVTCDGCGRTYSIIGDRVTSLKCRWFLDELEILKRRKNHMLYALYLCQACESFFEQAILNKRLDRNRNLRDESGRVIPDKYNAEREKLDKTPVLCLCKGCTKTTFEKATFDNLRRLFLHDYPEQGSGKVKKAFETVENTDINTLRNHVVHKRAYRPTGAELQKYSSLVDAIYILEQHLKIDDSIHLLNEFSS